MNLEKIAEKYSKIFPKYPKLIINKKDNTAMFKYELTFIDMFGGIGGGSLGLERAGWKCVWYSDKLKTCNLIYARHYGDIKRDSRPIRQVDAKEVPDHTLLVAGFPCQSFSITGKRKGFADSRGTLFYDIARIVETKKPPLLLLENVKGLLSAQKGYCFYRILQTLDELGYDVEWQVLNSKCFGVPQNRERVFIIGHLREESDGQVFPIGRNNKKNSKEIKIKLVSKSKNQVNRVYNPNGLSPTLNTNTGGRHIPQILIIGNVYPSKHEAGNIYDTKGISPTIKCNGPRPNSKNISPKIVENNRIRRLTPVECERLQGFPDNWTKYGKTVDGHIIEISDSQRYKVLGNAMTVNVMEFLGNKLKGSLKID